jgi:hypothetical protein
MTNENIFLVLEAYKNEPLTVEKAFEKTPTIGWNDFLEIIKFLEKKQFISATINRNIFKITQVGLNNFIELKEIKAQKEKDETAERKKLHNESVMSSWKRITFWPIFLFGLFGGFYSGLDLINKKGNNIKEGKSQQYKQDSILKLKKLDTLILTQKKGDSLNHSNSELNK